MGEAGGRKPRVVIVGAGVSGLAAARRLHACAGDLLDLAVVEAGDRIGGRLLTSEFAGARVEMGATWIHGIDESPIYDIARKAGAVVPDGGGDAGPWERMDGFPTDPLTLAEGGRALEPSLLHRISALFTQLKDLIASGEASSNGGVSSVGAFLRSGFDSYLAKNRGDWVEEAAFAMHECGERTYTAVDDLDTLDLAAEEEYREFPGEHITLSGGYSRVPEFIASTLPPGAIRFGRSVSRVDWSSTSLPGDHRVRLHFDDGAVEDADHAIITVSLGVLKEGLHGKDGRAGRFVFSPPLPEAKRGAIERLGFGLVNKLFMELEAGNGKAKPPFPFLRMAFDPGRRAGEIPWWMRRTDSICPIHAGSRALLAWFVGQEAAALETMSDDEIIRGLHATLSNFSPPESVTGAFGKISKVRRSGWGRDPRFLGSYSYVAVGSSGDDQDALAQPLPPEASPSPLQVLFAGEATHRTRYATTHGAYLSGVREADRLLQLYGFDSCGFYRGPSPLARPAHSHT